jgi:hypothetical protein
MSTIPPSWAIALGVAAVLGVLVGVGIGRFGTLSWLATRVSYLFAGGLMGFLAIGIWPAWPLLAFIGGILGMGAVRDQRVADLGFLLTGFGGAWTIILGWGVLNDLADPAVHGDAQTLVWFLIGSAVLVLGLVVLIVRAALQPDPA